MSLLLSLALASAVVAACLSLAVLVRDFRSVGSLSFAGGMILVSAEGIFLALSLEEAVPAFAVGWQQLRLATMTLQPGIWLLFSLCYSRGNYREFLSRSRLMLGAAFGLPLVLLFFSPQSLVLGVRLAQPGPARFLVLGAPGRALHVLFLIAAVAVLVNLERTFRASVGTMRWRIKYMVLGLGVLFVFRIYTSSQAILYSTLNPALEQLTVWAFLLACGLVAFSVWRSAGASADIYPSHGLLYGSLTVLLAGIYLLIVGVLAQVVTLYGGDAALAFRAFMVLASLVGLSVLLLSERVRQRLRRFVSRHLRRPLYDYRKVWATFTGRTASLMNEADLCRAVAQWISETLDLLSVTVWLLDREKEQLVFGGSTSLPGSRAADAVESGAGVTALIQALKDHPYPVDMDESRAGWLAILRRHNPDFFPGKGGNRVCVPLVGSGQVLGIITVGDRVSGLPFSIEDFDLLKSIGDQVAASLLNIQLSARLLQAKELEAFQTMSAFFVHDLKNTASTLSLMLQNLEEHFDDPAFRQDSLRAVTRSVSRLEELISRLTLLRHELKMNPTEADLSQVVETALARLAGGLQASVTKSFSPLPKLALDVAQIEKVVVNLLLNAQDAVGKEGSIRVESGERPGWAVLSVADNGCGMSEEFIRRSLFRPFQTTKKKGLGIGMFHSKMIVDAHQGRIEVESQPGKGTTMRVLLPLGGITP